MNIRQIVVAAALLALAHPVALVAQPAPAKVSAEPQVSSQDIVDQTTEFANWTLALVDAAAPAIEASRSIQAQWAQAAQNRDAVSMAASFRPVLARTEQATQLARQRIMALDTPQFPALDLPQDVQTAELRSQMAETVDQIGSMIRAFHPLLDAIVNNDEAAGRMAAVQLFSAARALYSSQRLFARAGMATMQSDSPEYYAAEFDIIFFEAGGRLIDSASRLAAGNSDPEIGADLLRYADRVDEITSGGVAAAAAAKREHDDAATAPVDAATRLLSDRLQRMDTSQQQAFRVWRSFGTMLREGATRANVRPVTFSDIRTMTSTLGPIRTQLDEIGMEQARILAGQQ